MHPHITLMWVAHRESRQKCRRCTCSSPRARWDPSLTSFCRRWLFSWGCLWICDLQREVSGSSFRPLIGVSWNIVQYVRMLLTKAGLEPSRFYLPNTSRGSFPFHRPQHSQSRTAQANQEGVTTRNGGMVHLQYDLVQMGCKWYTHW
jgi:hypothetical protein